MGDDVVLRIPARSSTGNGFRTNRSLFRAGKYHWECGRGRWVLLTDASWSPQVLYVCTRLVEYTGTITICACTCLDMIC